MEELLTWDGSCRESYEATLASTQLLVSTSSHQAVVLVRSLFAPYRPHPPALDSFIATLLRSPDLITDFLMQFHYGIPLSAQDRAFTSAVTIAAG